jgi:hypothetical protein
MQDQKLDNNIGPVYIGRPLESFFNSLHASYYETFGRVADTPNSEGHSFNPVISEIFSPGTLSCLSTESDLTYPMMLFFITQYSSEVRPVTGNKSTLLISTVTPEELGFRMVAYNFRCGIKQLRAGHLVARQWPRLTKIAGQIIDKGIFYYNEEPINLKEILAVQENTSTDSQNSQDILSSSPLGKEPVGLILIHDMETDWLNNSDVTRRVEELRTIATDFQLSVIITHSVQDQSSSGIPSDVAKYFDFMMPLQAENNRYKLSVDHHEKGFVGTIPLVMHPEIGVMEDH